MSAPAGAGAGASAPQMAEKEFPCFPFPPYAIQKELMRHIYATLDAGGVGVFESPTGTGKTLSLLCAALTWLRDAQAAAAEPALPAPVDDDEPEWLRDHSRNAARAEAERATKEHKERRERVRKAAGRPETMGAFVCRPRPPAPQPAADGAAGDDDEFLLDDWNSGDEGDGPDAAARKRRLADDSDDSSSASGSDGGQGRQRRGARHGGPLGEEQDEYEPLQIIFCSRTHSQLAQVVGELLRTPFAEEVRTVVLAGRAQLCVNDAVRALGSAPRMNDRCAELKRAGSKRATKPKGAKRGAGADGGTSAGCPFLRKRRGAVAALKELVLAEPLEVEELAREGRAQGACAYYAARSAVPAAHLVLLPYASLLQSEMRETLGIRLNGAVLIVDEAHNLPEAVADSAAATLTGSAAAAAVAALNGYLARYRSRLSAGNLRHLATLLTAARALQRAVAAAAVSEAANPGAGKPPSRPPATPTDATRVLRLNDFLFEAGIDHVNMFTLGRYCRDSKVLSKVGGFGDAAAAAAAAAAPAAAAAEDGGAATGGTTAALQSLLAFLTALTAADGDGRVLLTRAGSAGAPTGRLKFTLLNPGSRFAPIAAAARAVVLVGGTLGPVAPLAAALFPGMPLSRLRTHACGHIVPPSNLLCLALGQGPSGAALDFAFRARGSDATVDELGRLLLNVCRVVPQGVVTFFPSFEYADACAARWTATGTMAALAAIKSVFREPRTASAVEALLTRYGAAALAPRDAQHPGGALLLCVVGGKLSEGINFSDGLGRGVVMVGLPYAPPSDTELSERMKWLDAAGPEQGGGAGAGRAHYEALCMRAVNQSIGRAIRHSRDFAAIVLADARWTKPGGVVTKLPAWISQSLVTVNGSFGEAHQRLHRFFRDRAAAAAADAAAAAAAPAPAEA